MTSQPVFFHPAALAETEAAVEWLRERSDRAAARFLDELERAIERIARQPDLFPTYMFGTRKVLLSRFPYMVVYRENDGLAEVEAVAHGRRRPGYWRERIS